MWLILGQLIIVLLIISTEYNSDVFVLTVLCIQFKLKVNVKVIKLTAYFSPGSLYLCTSGIFFPSTLFFLFVYQPFFPVLLSCYSYIHFTFQSSSETQPAHPSSSFCLPPLFVFLVMFLMFYDSLNNLPVSLCASPAVQRMVRKVRDVDSSFCLPTSFPFSSVLILFIILFIFPSLLSHRLLQYHCLILLLFNTPVPPCCPLRSFPNFWSPSGAAWRGLFLSSLPSRQEQHWNSKLCLLSTTTTRRPTNC